MALRPCQRAKCAAGLVQPRAESGSGSRPTARPPPTVRASAAAGCVIHGGGTAPAAGRHHGGAFASWTARTRRRPATLLRPGLLRVSCRRLTAATRGCQKGKPDCLQPSMATQSEKETRTQKNQTTTTQSCTMAWALAVVLPWAGRRLPQASSFLTPSPPPPHPSFKLPLISFPSRIKISELLVVRAPSSGSKLYGLLNLDYCTSTKILVFLEILNEY